MSVFRVTVLAGAAMLLGACSTIKPAEELGANQQPLVDMSVDQANQVFKIDTKATKACVNEGKDVNGCFEVPENKVARARFQLQGSPGWQIQRMRICLGDNDTTQNCNLTDFNRLEFAAVKNRSDKTIEVPDSSGYINIARIEQNLKGFFLLNQNLYEQWWYYQIQVCPDGTDAENDVNDAACLWNEDPPMKNRGRISG